MPKCTKGVVLYLVILALVMRLPYFFEAVIDWDESTFILLGQSVLDGHLPYTELLDVKPPLLWVCFALFISVFGKTVVSIRLAGTICVVLTAFMTYLIGRKIWKHEIGFISGILFIIIAGISPSGQAVMSEHIALIPLMAALTLLITKQNTLWNLFFSGALMTTASLIRLNLAYAVIAVGLAILLYPPMNLDQQSKSIIYRGIAYTLGGLSIILLTIVPYLIVRQEQIWRTGVVIAPLSYSNVKNSLFFILSQQITGIWQILIGETSIAVIGIAVLVWLGGLLQILLTLIYWKRLDAFQKRATSLLLIMLLGIEISILKGGLFNTHYLIQFNAILSLFSAVLIHKLLSGRYRRVVKSFIVLTFVLVFLHVSLKYARLSYELVYNHRILYGSAYEIAEFLNQENVSREPVLLFTNHLAYWLTNSKPLSPVMAHPSNLNREFLLKIWLGKEASRATELSKILDKHPKFIIGGQFEEFIEDLDKENFDKSISENYTFVKKIDYVKVYKRVGSLQ